MRNVFTLIYVIHIYIFDAQSVYIYTLCIKCIIFTDLYSASGSDTCHSQKMLRVHLQAAVSFTPTCCLLCLHHIAAQQALTMGNFSTVRRMCIATCFGPRLHDQNSQ